MPKIHEVILRKNTIRKPIVKMIPFDQLTMKSKDTIEPDIELDYYNLP